MLKVPKFKKASKAAEWIADNLTKKTWTQGVEAKDANGVPTDPENADAVQFCALGWIAKANQGFNNQLSLGLKEVLLSKQYSETEIEEYNFDSNYVCIENWNDDSDRTPAQVRNAFRSAAKLLALKEKAKTKKAKDNLPKRGEFI